MIIEEYAQDLLKSEISIIENSDKYYVYPELSIYEKAIILKYSDDGYEDLNEKLRASSGKDFSVFGVLLLDCLNKLRNFVGNVYRGINLTKKELENYENAFLNDKPITEHFFISTSRSQLIGKQFGKTKFEIFTKSGKNIERIAKHTNELEVLIPCNCRFRVISFETNLIQLLEI